MRASEGNQAEGINEERNVEAAGLETELNRRSEAAEEMYGGESRDRCVCVCV